MKNEPLKRTFKKRINNFILKVKFLILYSVFLNIVLYNKIDCYKILCYNIFNFSIL
jgi:hypothetical protein